MLVGVVLVRMNELQKWNIFYVPFRYWETKTGNTISRIAVIHFFLQYCRLSHLKRKPFASAATAASRAKHSLNF